MKHLLILAMLASTFVLAGCATKSVSRGLPSSPEDFLFSIAHSKETDNLEETTWEQRIDVFFRYEDPPSPLIRGMPRLIICGKVRPGEESDLFGGDSASCRRLEGALDELNFQPFDYDQEVTAATERMIQDGEARAKKTRLPVEVYTGDTFDGGMFVITYHYKGTKFTLKAHEPGPKIDALAPFSPKIAKLKKLIEIFASAYGREVFRL